MRFPWHSDRGHSVAPATGNGGDYTSDTVVQSQTVRGVTFTIAKISFGRRTELMRRVRELARKAEFLMAGADAGQKMDAAILHAEIERLYVIWGVTKVTGLTVDGSAAGPELLIESGPEGLFQEALAAVRKETGLTEDERKNS
jgi:hypothetical protein